jgi:hypothetical protein
MYVNFFIVFKQGQINYVIFAEISTGIEEIVIIFTVIRKDELDF